MKPKYVVRQIVEADLEQVWFHTYTNWGIEQADTYTISLIDRFAWLAENPHAGKQRDDVKPGYFSFPEGMHIVFYKIGKEGVEIIGIPHQNMDYVEYFEG